MMMMRSMFGGRIAMYIMVLVVGLAIWKANDGDVSKIADTAWNALNAAADTVLELWNQFNK